MNAARRTLTALLLVALPGCSSLEGLFSDDEPAATAEETKAPEAAATDDDATAASSTAAPSATAGTGAWRVFIILDTSADRSFFAPEQALTKALEGTGVKVVRAWSLDTPVEVKNDAGEVIGVVELKKITDQGKGYVLAEADRPADFVAPSSLPFVFQQASAYYNMQIRMQNGRMAGQGGLSGARPRRQMAGGEGTPKNPAAARERMKMQKGAPGLRKIQPEGKEASEGEAAGE